jgi:hypothetical protein
MGFIETKNSLFLYSPYALPLPEAHRLICHS